MCVFCSAKSISAVWTLQYGLVSIGSADVYGHNR